MNHVESPTTRRHLIDYRDQFAGISVENRNGRSQYGREEARAQVTSRQSPLGHYTMTRKTPFIILIYITYH